VSELVSPLWWVVIGAVLATYLWRFLGAAFSYRIDTESKLFEWITCVSYAMLAGLISRMIFIPVGPLIETSLWSRVVCVIIGLAVFFLAGRRVLVGVAAGLLTFIGWISVA